MYIPGDSLFAADTGNKIVKVFAKKRNLLLTLRKSSGILYELSQKATESQQKRLKEIKKVEKKLLTKGFESDIVNKLSRTTVNK